MQLLELLLVFAVLGLAYCIGMYPLWAYRKRPIPLDSDTVNLRLLSAILEGKPEKEMIFKRGWVTREEYLQILVMGMEELHAEFVRRGIPMEGGYTDYHLIG